VCADLGVNAKVGVRDRLHGGTGAQSF